MTNMIVTLVLGLFFISIVNARPENNSTLPSCEAGSWRTGNECEKCGCSTNGVVENEVCNNSTGKCSCKVGYSGDKCDNCDAGYWHTGNECKKCNCSANGVVENEVCNNSTGKCNCKTGHNGDKCNNCNAGYWRYGNECKKCNCSTNGVDETKVCNNSTGKCICKEGYTSSKNGTCDQCALPVRNSADNNDVSGVQEIVMRMEDGTCAFFNFSPDRKIWENNSEVLKLKKKVLDNNNEIAVTTGHYYGLLAGVIILASTIGVAGVATGFWFWRETKQI